MDEESRGYFLHDLFESLIQEERDRNITIIGYPKEITVLSKRFENDPSLSEEFRMFVRGGSYCYGCTELIDYEEQKKRIEEQTKFWGKNEKKLDDNFIEMLKIGLPPCAGLGLSLERLQAVYLDLDDVRDVIAFPLKK
jgi:lysyl-tRNA synthetase class 2